MKANTTLTSVNLSYNGLSDDGAVALGRYVRVNNTLVVLDVTNNRISAIGAKAFASGLKKNERLEILRVRLATYTYDSTNLNSNDRFDLNFVSFL